jgi:hypothetical protein
MVAFSQVKPNTIKLRALPMFPSRVTVGTGLATQMANGVRNFDIDFSNLERDDDVTPTELASLYVSAWDSTEETFRLYLGSSLKGEQGDQGVPGPATASDFEKNSSVTSATIAGTVNYLRTSGYAAAGDGGGALYKRSTGPAASGKIQSADGTYWLISEPIISAKMLGATGDGVTNDTAAILRAITVAGANGALYFPPGTYLVNPVVSTATLILPSGLRVFGAGIDRTTIKCASTILSPQGQTLFYTSGTGDSIENLTINGGGLTSIQRMILMTGCTRPALRNLRVTNCAANLFAIEVSDSYDGEFDNIITETYTGTFSAPTDRGHAIALVNTVKEATYHRISNIYIRGGLFGLSVWRQKQCVISNLIIEDYPSSSTFGGAGDGVNWDNSSDCSVTNATILGRKDAGVVLYTTTIGSVPENNVFSNIVSESNLLDGFYISAGKNNFFNNISVLNNNLGNPTFGNRFGIYVNVDSGTTTDNNIFNGVLATDTQGTKTQTYGIAVAAGPTNTKFFNCRLDGNLTGDVSDSGTNTVVTKMLGLQFHANRGFSASNGGDGNSGFWSYNLAGTAKRVVYVANTGALADGTVIRSAGGGVTVLNNAATDVFLVEDGGLVKIWDTALKTVSFGANDSGGAGYKVLRIPN